MAAKSFTDDERESRRRITVAGSLCVAEHGYSLHAATRAGSHDETGRERFIRYVLRPPLATEHLKLLPDERVRLGLKKPFSDGTMAIELAQVASTRPH